MGTGSFPGVKSDRGVTLTPHPLLVPWSRKGRAISLLPRMGRTACTEPQCLYKGGLYLLRAYSSKFYYELCRTSKFCHSDNSYRIVARSGTEYHPVGSNTKYFIHILILGFLHFVILNILTLRRLMSYIHGAPILDVSRSHTTTQHSR